MSRATPRHPPFSAARRHWLAAMAGGTLACLAPRAMAMGETHQARLFNPCLKLDAALRKHPLTLAAFDGVNASDVWDCHAHLLGFGESGGGAWVTPKMKSVFHLRMYAQFNFYLNASCVDPGKGNVDGEYVERMRALADDFPTGAKAMLMAFDRVHKEDRTPDQAGSAFYIPNAYAAKVARAHADRFEWTASIHPYREDAADEVAKAVRDGAVAVKWLPSAMGIDPASPLCDKFYDEMARHDLPLISHGGEEKAVEGAKQHANGNVLKLRRPLERGLRVIVAHCASLGTDTDIDQGPDGPQVECFALFERLMAEPAFEGRLFGDISALPQKNRMHVLPRVAGRREWEGRLVNGSDYPLPGVFPLFAVDEFMTRGWITADVGEHLKRVRAGNPMLFDFLLKRHLKIDGRTFARAVFETARVFRRPAKAIA
ncbi:MAG: amidohydrolase family protein [Betaproteobacteria bacterium]|nr:amidohydrolase family protein [Betaproteobacteria bacterium]